MSRVFTTLAAVALAAVLLPAARAEDAVKPLAFAWPVPSKVRVTEKITLPGRGATTRYVVSLARVEEGKDVLRVHIGDFEIVELDGRPATDPLIATAVALSKARGNAMPDLLLSADGRVTGLAGVEEAIDAALAGSGASATDAEKVDIAKRRAALSSPEAKELMKREARGYWDPWVAGWVGLALEDDKPVSSTVQIRCPDGVDRDATCSTRRRPAEETGRIQLLRESALTPESAKQALDAWIKKMTEATQQAPPEGFFTGLDISERVLAVTDPATLAPLRVIRESKATVRRKNGEDTESVERHEYAFDWDVK